MAKNGGPGLTRREVLLGGTVTLAWTAVGAAVLVGGDSDTDGSDPEADQGGPEADQGGPEAAGSDPEAAEDGPGIESGPDAGGNDSADEPATSPSTRTA